MTAFDTIVNARQQRASTVVRTVVQEFDLVALGQKNMSQNFPVLTQRVNNTQSK